MSCHHAKRTYVNGCETIACSQMFTNPRPQNDFHPGTIIVTSRSTLRYSDRSRFLIIVSGVGEPPNSKNICRQRHPLWTAASIVADGNCRCEDPKIRWSEPNVDSARHSCSHACTTGVILGIIDCIRSRDCDSGNVQCRAPGIGQCRCLRWTATPADEVQAGWDKLHYRTCSI